MAMLLIHIISIAKTERPALELVLVSVELVAWMDGTDAKTDLTRLHAQT